MRSAATLVVLAVVAGGAMAQAPGPFGSAAGLDEGYGADVNRGRFIAFGGEFQTQRIACVQCHGLDGSGSSSGAFPRLAGLGDWYLYKALADYAAGRRPNRIMGPIAKALTEGEMRDVAAYYASLVEPVSAPPSEVEFEVVQVGGALAAVGAPSDGIPACSGCHGAKGLGLDPIVPRLAGQYAAYLEHQLHLWKEGLREGDAMNVMERIAKVMSDEQIRAVSLYYASIQPGEIPAPAVMAGPVNLPEMPEGKPDLRPPYLTGGTMGAIGGATKSGPPGGEPAEDETAGNGGAGE